MKLAPRTSFCIHGSSMTTAVRRCGGYGRARPMASPPLPGPDTAARPTRGRIGPLPGMRRPDDGRADWDTRPVELTMRSLVVLSPDEVAITLADEAGAEVTFRFTGTQAGGIRVINGDQAFRDRYRPVPGPALPMWPERLAGAALSAVREPLPAGEALDELTRQARRELGERWRRCSPET